MIKKQQLRYDQGQSLLSDFAKSISSSLSFTFLPCRRREILHDEKINEIIYEEYLVSLNRIE